MHEAQHGETRLPTHWEGKGLLGATGWDTSRQEGALPLLWHAMPSVPALSRAPWGTLAEPTPCTLGHSVGSQMVSTKGL